METYFFGFVTGVAVCWWTTVGVAVAEGPSSLVPA
jgi:hypothetical protein